MGTIQDINDVKTYQDFLDFTNNQKPLYRVEGIKNDYIGEWHKVNFEAFAELVELVS